MSARVFERFGRAVAIFILGLRAALLPVAGVEPQSITLPAIHNAFDLGGGVYSGSSPEGEAGFAALAQLGVKTIISVDGAKPDVAAARKFGLRYVHLPFGYDGIPAERELALGKAAAAFSGSIFVHCHHGKHRGPAAAAIVCKARDGWSTETATAWMKLAGTADDYAGLYRAVREYRAPEAAVFTAAQVALPETSPTPALVDAMVAMDEHFDLLKAAQKRGWTDASQHPGLPIAETATLLWEQLRELRRNPEAQTRDADFRSQLSKSEREAEALRQLLREPRGEHAPIDIAFQRVGKSCTECHKAHRN